MLTMSRRVAVTSLGALLMPAWLLAQSSQQATIAGVVKDGSGGVLPGVTVEASSPVLIEKVRTTITGGSGDYKLVSLSPGPYHCHLHARRLHHCQTRGHHSERLHNRRG